MPALTSRIHERTSSTLHRPRSTHSMNRGGPADPEGDRVLDRSGRWTMDTGPHRGGQGLPDRPGGQADRTVDATTVAAFENAIAKAQQPKPTASPTPSAAVTTTPAS